MRGQTNLLYEKCLATCSGQKKTGGSRLANMWSKAPAVKEKPKPKQAAKSTAAAAPAVDADAALRSAQQVLPISAEKKSKYDVVARRKLRPVKGPCSCQHSIVDGDRIGTVASSAYGCFDME